MTSHQMQKRLREFASAKKAKLLQGFFKTGPGQYGEGDIFLGVVVPDLRKVAGEFQGVSLTETRTLLTSVTHEERLLALLLLVRAYEQGDARIRSKVYELYLKSTKYINNWDLVDLSAPNIVGKHLEKRGRKPLYDLAGSRDLWKRRIAVLSTFAFIKQNDFDDSLAIAAILLPDEHDLIHKAVGWMLREVGKRSLAAEERFLRQYYKKMPRTMLRYAIERFPEPKRKRYLDGKV
jgi:3-methyladenine DNA glycosylase AlkD